VTYQVAWTSPGRRDLTRLPPRIAQVILTYVDERLAENPQRLSKSLQGSLEGLRSARSGDYRVLFRLDEERERLFIIRVDHRAHAYRPH
jgi:mRNA-degrading endonuclease RelE of RelBE toxin-antitoxin system